MYIPNRFWIELEVGRTPHIMYFIRPFCVFVVFAFLCPIAGAQSRSVFFDDRAVFKTASERVRTINFEEIAPSKGFGKYPPAVGLTVDGISFRTIGGARFGSGTIYVPSAHYIAGNPGLKMLDGAHLSWGAPNQPVNAHLELGFPRGVNAISADVWASQPVVSPIEIRFTTRDGRTHTSTITTRKRPDGAFAGFVSESEISTVRFTLAKGQTSLLLDNLAYGRKAEGIDLVALASPAAAAPERTEDEKPVASTLNPRTQTPRTAASVSAPGPNKASTDTRVAIGATSTSPGTGRIAYARGGT